MPLARRVLSIYTFWVHNNSVSPLPFPPAALSPDNPRPHIRAAVENDADRIATLIACYIADGLMLPRTTSRIALTIDNYIVADADGEIVACAALEEYSPSLAEVSCVAVARSHHGSGLGSQVVLGVERLARARNIGELFALSLSEGFFFSLDYTASDILNYPEKQARYDAMIAAGHAIVPKPCFKKVLGNSWELPQLVPSAFATTQPARRAS